MSAEKQLIGEINIELVSKLVQLTEDFLNKGLRSGAFTIKDAHDMYECYDAIVKTVEQCDLLQKKLKHLVRQQELIQQAEQSQPVAPSQ